MLPLPLTLALVAVLPSTEPALTGQVRDAAGRPVPKATVFIRTAAPRKGVGVL